MIIFLINKNSDEAKILCTVGRVDFRKFYLKLNDRLIDKDI